MFDNRFGVDVYNYIDKRGPSRVIVTENRAPTDESIKLLKEMEEKVEKKVLSTLTSE